MTEPAPTEPAPTEPAPTEPAPLTGTELEQAVAAAAREYIQARLARPRDAQRIADAKTDLDALIALRDQLTAGG